MRRRAFPPSGDVGWRICRRRENQSRSKWKSTEPSSVITIAMALPDPGSDFTSDPGSLSRPSSAVQHSIHLNADLNADLNAETFLPSIWRCRLADMSPSREPTPVEIATALPDPDTPRPFPASSGFALLRDFRAPLSIQWWLNNVRAKIRVAEKGILHHHGYSPDLKA